MIDVKEGGYYRLRNGEEVGPVYWQDDCFCVAGLIWPRGLFGMWNADGSNWMFPNKEECLERNEFDIVERVG
jgi:hypothetical protein